MKPVEIKILKYIYKKTKLPISEVHSHFVKYDKTLIDGVLTFLESDGYIRMKGKVITITDRGQIEAESAKIINEEKWKDRIIGFLLGFASAILSSIVINLVMQYI